MDLGAAKDGNTLQMNHISRAKLKLEDHLRSIETTELLLSISCLEITKWKRTTHHHAQHKKNTEY